MGRNNQQGRAAAHHSRRLQRRQMVATGNGGESFLEALQPRRGQPVESRALYDPRFQQLIQPYGDAQLLVQPRLRKTLQRRRQTHQQQRHRYRHPLRSEMICELNMREGNALTCGRNLLSAGFA